MTTTPPLADDSRASSLVACPDCDLLQRVGMLHAGAKACCARCGCVLARRPRHGHDLPLALAITAAIVFVVANTSPLMSLSAVGRSSSTTLIGGAVAMWQQGQPITAALVLFCMVVAPAVFIGSVLGALLLLSRRQRLPAWCGEALRHGASMQPWAMFEVMLLGILVALIKIADLASVEAGVGLYSLGLLALLFPAMLVSVDMRQLWPHIAWRSGAARQRSAPR